MNTNKLIVHLSDLHYRERWEEDQGLVLDSFFKDLSKQLSFVNPSDVFLAFSGDLVQAGARQELYDGFFRQFDAELNRLKIPKAQRICVPGNHDISDRFVQTKFLEHEGLIVQNLDERRFNDYVSQPNCLFLEKFDNYLKFENRFAGIGIAGFGFTGRGWELDDNIGIYCLNSAICASGGVEGRDDHGRLAIDTRNLQKWIIECKAKTKILVMHHSLECLTNWAGTELRKILNKEFALCLSGHVHDQSVLHSVQDNGSLVHSSAPPLLTNKRGKLGYSFVTVNSSGVVEIQYRQWTQRHIFVSGVDFSNTDTGKVLIVREDSSDSADSVCALLTQRLDDALRSFSSQPIIWVDPIISKTNDLTHQIESNPSTLVQASEIVANPESICIQAAPQFGLTCLAHYLVKEAWIRHSSRWLFLDATEMQAHSVEKSVRKKLNSENLQRPDIKCVIVDSWTSYDKESAKLINVLCTLFVDLPIIIMQTVDDSKFRDNCTEVPLVRKFHRLFLLALPRGRIRQVVSEYNRHQHIADEDTLLSKVISDLETLNIHRTPLNCITLLKVAEKHFDESPVNRTKMLEMVLFLLFNMDGLPTYKVRPDLKDCEYVLGRFCEKMIRREQYEFTHEDFIKEMRAFCAEKLIDLEVEVVFDILFSNGIIVKWAGYYKFRFRYWIFYFAARRMHGDEGFCSYIFAEKKYVSFPEIIEFYSGIDRARTDALTLLIRDLRESCDAVQCKIGLPDGMNPYRGTKWALSDESISNMKAEVSDSVAKSNLPDAVKDRFLDRGYDQVRPYDQTVHLIYREYSLSILWQNIKAASRALRNSDYADPAIKREMLDEIMRSWELLTKVLIVLTPALAVTGHAVFEGHGFRLMSDFGKTVEQRIPNIWAALPRNVVKYFSEDIFSAKIGPLLFDYLDRDKSEIRRHELMILLIRERPREWNQRVRDYISTVPRNSLYLYDVLLVLQEQYRYSFTSPEQLAEIAYLIKMVIAKHELGHNKPGPEHIKRISNGALPKRADEEDLT